MADTAKPSTSVESPFDAAYRKAVAEYELPETDDAEIVVEDAGSYFFTEGWFAGIQSVRAKATE